MMPKKYKVIWTSQAELDLIKLVIYIALRDPGTAQEKFDLIRIKSDLLTQYPYKGRVVPELKQLGVRKYREVIVDPWRLVYTTHPSEVNILAVIDSRRNLTEGC